MRKLSVSILPSDFSRLAEVIGTVENAGADWIHVDVMDGHFVPNLTMGPVIVKAIRQSTPLPLDVHLMMDNPDDYLEAFVDAGANRIGVHAEVARHLHRTLQQIRKLGAKPTVTLNPATPLSVLDYVLNEVDMVLLMTVNPGFSGQDFIRPVLPKIRELRHLIDRLELPVLLEVDGGVHLDTIDDLTAAGADVFVAGSAVFNDRDIAENIRILKEKIK